MCVCVCARTWGHKHPLVCKKKFKKDKTEAAKNGIQKGKRGRRNKARNKGTERTLQVLTCETCKYFVYFKN